MAEPSPKRYIQYLPAIFQRKPIVPGEPILGQFLAPFEKQYAGFEEILAWVDRNFSASFATAEDFLPWLAQWVALVFDEAWDEDTRRRLLAEAMELYRWRGTVRGRNAIWSSASAFDLRRSIFWKADGLGACRSTLLPVSDMRVTTRRSQICCLQIPVHAITTWSTPSRQRTSLPVSTFPASLMVSGSSSTTTPVSSSALRSKRTASGCTI